MLAARPYPPMRETKKVDKLANILRRELQPTTVSQQSRFLYQFFDPGAGVYRGPNKSSLPTICYKTTSVTQFTLDVDPNLDPNKTGVNFEATSDVASQQTDQGGMYRPTYNGNPTSDKFNGVYYCKAEGQAIAICAMPHRLRTIGGGQISADIAEEYAAIPAAISPGLAAGFVCPVNVTYSTPMYTNYRRTLAANGTTEDDFATPDGYMYPLNPLVAPFLEIDHSGVNCAHYGNASPIYAKGDVKTAVPMRCIGCIMEISIVATPLDAKGVVIAGDNRALYNTTTETTANWQEQVNLTSPGLTFYGDDLLASANVNPNPSENVFNGVSISQNRRDMGEFMRGQMYRCAFIPSNDRILEYRSELSNFSAWNMPNLNAPITPSVQDMVCNRDPNSAHGYYSTIGEMLANNPMAYITVSSWKKGISIRVKTTYSYEALVANSAPNAPQMDNARYAQNYIVNWGAIQGVYGAGINGDNLLAALDHGVIRNGMAAALGAAETPAPTSPLGWNIGVAALAPAVRMAAPPKTARALAPTLAGHASAADHSSGSTTAADLAADAVNVAAGAAIINANKGSAASMVKGIGTRIAEEAKGALGAIESLGGKAVGLFERAAPFLERAGITAVEAAI